MTRANILGTQKYATSFILILTRKLWRVNDCLK